MRKPRFSLNVAAAAQTKITVAVTSTLPELYHNRHVLKWAYFE